MFSLAYVRAVAAAVGIETIQTPPGIDADGVDVQFAAAGKQGTLRAPRLEAQLKATAHPIYDGKYLKFDLKRKNYDDLIHADFVIPRILIVVVLPGEDPKTWLSHSPEELRLRKCGYAVSLAERQPTANKDSIR